MAIIESKKVQVNAQPEQVFNYLSDMNNIIHLLPEGKVSDWKSDEKSCSFKLQGAYTIGLEMESSQPHQSITYKSSGGSPLSFTLTAHLNGNGSGTEAYQVCDANLNPFLEMVAKGPLKSLFDYMAEQLSKQW